MIISDGPGLISTPQRAQSQDHTQWPCVPHTLDVPCDDAIASYATKQGARVVRAEQERSHP